MRSHEQFTRTVKGQNNNLLDNTSSNCYRRFLKSHSTMTSRKARYTPWYLTPHPFNTSDLDPLANLCKDLGLGIPAPSMSVAYEDFQLKFLEDHQDDGLPSTARDLHRNQKVMVMIMAYHLLLQLMQARARKKTIVDSSNKKPSRSNKKSPMILWPIWDSEAALTNRLCPQITQFWYMMGQELPHSDPS